MKVLIFYSKTGGGHLRAAEALAESIKLKKHQVVLYDGLEKIKLGLKTNPDLFFFLFSHYLNHLYNFLYILTDNRLGLKVLRKIIKSIWGNNFQQIIEKESPDLIITTHHFISPTTVQNNKKIPFVVEVLDLGKPHSIWFDEKADLTIVPNQAMLTWAEKKFPKLGNIKSLGYPLNKHFVREKSSIKKSILILGTGNRRMYVRKWVYKIKEKLPYLSLTVVCGYNRVLYKSLKNTPNITTLAFIDNLHEIMQKSDIIITKAGPGIIMEAATLGKPIIITKWLGMQEKGNVDFVVSNNLGLYDFRGKNIISSILKIYDQYKTYTNNSDLFSFNTDRIVDYILNSVYI